MKCRSSSARNFCFAMLTLLLSAYSGVSFAAPGQCGKNFSWMVDEGSLFKSTGVFPLKRQEALLDQRCSFLIVGDQPSAQYAGWWAMKARSIKSISTIEADAANGNVQALVYDPEVWSFTPVLEQQHPAEATCAAANVAHAHGKLLVAAPGIDLARVLNPRGASQSGQYVAFTQSGVAGPIAKCADIYEIQAQSLEGDAKAFQSFVSTIALQARAANPHIVIMVGLSTNPPGVSGLTPQTLLDAVKAVAGVTDGFWLNIPSPGALCPNCGPSNPALAQQLLEQLPTSSN